MQVRYGVEGLVSYKYKLAELASTSFRRLHLKVWFVAEDGALSPFIPSSGTLTSLFLPSIRLTQAVFNRKEQHNCHLHQGKKCALRPLLCTKNAIRALAEL